MKKRDLKSDLQLTEIDKREEGEIAEEGGGRWRKRDSNFKKLFLGIVTGVRGLVSRGLTSR